jgi:hypothetical protein
MVASHEKSRQHYRAVVLCEDGTKSRPIKINFLDKSTARHYAQLWINANNEPAKRKATKR